MNEEDDIDTAMNLPEMGGMIERIRLESTADERSSGIPDRFSIEVAERMILDFVPDPSARSSWLTLLADSIERANKLGGQTWAVTLRLRRLSLNVNGVYALVLQRGVAHLSIDIGGLLEDDLTLLRNELVGEWPPDPFDRFKTSFMFTMSTDRVPNLTPALLGGHARFIRQFSGQVGGNIARAHSPGVLEYLRNELSRNLPDPMHGPLQVQGRDFRNDSEGVEGSTHGGGARMLSKSIAAAGLSYSRLQIATFYTALQTKGFVILSGISGTGKTKLPQHFAAILAQVGASSEPNELVPNRQSDEPASLDWLDEISAESANPKGDGETGQGNEGSWISYPEPIVIKPHNLNNGGRLRLPPSIYQTFIDRMEHGSKTSIDVSVDGVRSTSHLKHQPRYQTGDAEVRINFQGYANPKFSSYNVGDRLWLRTRSGSDGVPNVFEFTSANPSDEWRDAESPGNDDQDEEDEPESIGEPIIVTPEVAASNLLFLSVRPDWRDSKSLLGYYNPLTQTYEWTPFLRFLMRAAESHRTGDGLAWFVVLDEMNLAHVEYYFADLLSVLESGRDADGWSREPLRLNWPEDATGDLPPRELRLPPNLYLIGTVNVDETAHAFSPKVLDRAFTMELTEVDFRDYPVPQSQLDAPAIDEETRRQLLASFTRDGRFAVVDKGVIAAYVSEHGAIRGWLQTLNDLLRPANLHFGYRVFDEVVSFLDAADDNGLFASLGGTDIAFDAAVLMKVLPKFHGSRGKLERPLISVLAWCIDPQAPDPAAIADLIAKEPDAEAVSSRMADLDYRLPLTADRARRMLWSLHTDGFAAFG